MFLLCLPYFLWFITEGFLSCVCSTRLRPLLIPIKIYIEKLASMPEAKVFLIQRILSPCENVVTPRGNGTRADLFQQPISDSRHRAHSSAAPFLD